MQNAFLIPPPAPQQTTQARPPHRPFDRDAFSGNDGQDSSFASFMSFLNDAVDKADKTESEASPMPGVAFPAGNMPEEYTANVSLFLGDNRVLSKSILDLMASLKSDLENNSVDLAAWHGRIGSLLNEAGIEWGSEAAGAMMAKLRHDMRLMFMGNGETLNADTEMSLLAQLKLSLEPLLAANAVDTSDTSEEKAYEYALPASDGQSAAVQSQLLQNLNYHPCLKQDTSKEVTAVHSERSTYISITSENGVEKKPQDGFSNNLSDQAGNEEKHWSGLRNAQTGSEDKHESGPRQDASPRFELQGGGLNKNADESKANPAEHKAPFEQFFDNVMAQRGTSEPADAPKLSLGNGPQVSQGETLHDGISNVIRFIRAGGEQRANLIVDPPALGRISIELVSGTAGLEASIKVSSEQIRQLIQDHLDQLKLSLEQQGVQLTHFSVDVQQDDTRGSHNHGDKSHRRGRRGEEDSGEEELLPGFQVDLSQGLLYWIA
jgi:flagellar hook-length control protein FliK